MRCKNKRCENICEDKVREICYECYCAKQYMAAMKTVIFTKTHIPKGRLRGIHKYMDVVLVVRSAFNESYADTERKYQCQSYGCKADRASHSEYCSICKTERKRGNKN